jgi:outer membrane lipoprotein SlyB
MSDLPATRRYDETEVSRLLKRAAELQRAAPSVPGPTGLTLSELEEIASEAGLDVTMLRRAAAELDAAGAGGPATLGVRLAGAPLRILLEQTLPYEVPDTVFAELVPLIQVASSAVGQASQVGHSLTWSAQTQSSVSSFQVLVSVCKGETRIRIEARFDNLAGALFGGGLGGFGGGVGIGAGGALAAALGGGALFFAIPAAIIGGTYAAARAIFGSYVNGRKRTLERLMERIVEILAPHDPTD